MSDISPYSQPKPPKTITKVKDDRFLDFTCIHTWITLTIIGIGLYLFRMIANEFLYKNYYDVLMYFGIAYLVGNVWYRFFRTEEKTQYNIDKLKFLISDKRGKHVVNTFDTLVDELEMFIPIKKIHENGIIEFAGNEFGIIMETHPNRISDEEREQHEKKLEKLVNGIPANTHFKTLSCSVLEPRKPILNFLLDLSSKAGTFKPRNQHLTDLYLKISEDDSKVIAWKYYAFLSLGKQKNIDQAKIQYGAVVPGLLKNMKGANLRPRILTETREIIDCYRTMFSEVAV